MLRKMRVECSVAFSGGLELLFDNEKTLSLSVPMEGGALTLDQLIVYIRDNCLKERPELFVADDSVYVLPAHSAVAATQHHARSSAVAPASLCW